MHMPTITIYLTNDLYDKVRDAPSKIVRAALEYYFKSDNTDKPSEESDEVPQYMKEREKPRTTPTHQ
jgi:hypothetical protein